MKKEENLEKNISELFNGFEPSVDPHLWLKIKQKINKKEKREKRGKKETIKKVFLSTAVVSSLLFLVIMLVFYNQEKEIVKEKTTLNTSENRL